MSFPKNTPAELNEYFGRHEFTSTGEPAERWKKEHLTDLETQFPLRLSVEPSHYIRIIRCNVKTRHAISNILQGIWDTYDRDLNKVQKAKADIFGGCYLFFPTKDGSRLSLHAWGAAIALGPSGKPHPVISKLFEAEGWQCDGSNIYAAISN